MSKMQTKKKSCFQITSVTQAQVVASSIPDDTESLDDLEESQTEDVSSEVFDVSRVDLGMCDRSSSDETLSTAGEPHDTQLPNTSAANEGACYKGIGTAHGVGGSVSVPEPAQPLISNSITSTVSAASVSTSVAHTAPVSASCSSRFRVIKLDHGMGEPFKRGRWTCTEFYERDSDSNVNRTVDSVKPALNHDPSLDRESGLGATSSSVVTSSAFSAQALGNTTGSGHSVSVGHHNHPHPSESQQQGYSLASQIGSGPSAFQSTGHKTSASQSPQHAPANMQPVAPQTLQNINGVHQGTMQQKSTITPSASQPQQFTYSSHQHHFGSSSQNLTGGSSVSKITSPVITSAGSGSVGLSKDATSSQNLLIQSVALSPSGNGQQYLVTQPLGGLGSSSAPSITTTTSPSSGQIVPASVPSTANTPPGVPSGAGGLVQPQGSHGGTATSFSNQTEDGRKKTNGLPQHSASVMPGEGGVKPFIREGLSLHTPAVNSLFGIHISMNVDENSVSGASVVAIDNKIEQAMDLVKSHLMYAVREEVEVLKEQIKELYERNSQLERENAVLKSLANAEQLSRLSSQLNQGSGSRRSSPPLQQQHHNHQPVANHTPSLVHHEGNQSVPHQPNISSV
ncbi:TSC22 domain family protein 2-like [Pholidichthys leucotaenia]